MLGALLFSLLLTHGAHAAQSSQPDALDAPPVASVASIAPGPNVFSGPPARVDEHDTAFDYDAMVSAQRSQDAGKETKPPESDAGGDLTQKATNPIGDLIQVQLQNQFNWDNYESDGWSNQGIVQPVIPVKLPWDALPMMITRTTISYVNTPDLGHPIDRHDGLGDVFALALGLPKLNLDGQMVGLGAAISLPTATDDFTGSGKCSGGPAAVYVNTKSKGWMWGVLGWQVWSFAGDRDREDVSSLAVQPFVTRQLGRGWYVGTQDVPWTYNWKTGGWTMPLGVKVGRVTKLGRQAVNIFGEVMGTPLHDGPVPKWSFKVGLSLLFPGK
jgi:hypothetical protein